MIRFSILILAIALTGPKAFAEKPNILWIFVDDMSDWVGCYGDNTVPTPNIDSLGESGVLFRRAYMPSPVCSTTRSALITGTMQTTHGLHLHRTMIKKPLPETVQTAPQLFRQAGYLTFNEAKDDYNFSLDRAEMYSPEFQRPKYRSHLNGRDVSWLEQLKGKTFFGQIQLAGGKFGGETGNKYPAPSRVSEESVTVPPQYPDHPVMRNAIARHYEQIVETDEQVGAIINGLKEYDLWNNTIVFFFTDHGCPLPRSKQFLYEEGLKVPLIVRVPERFQSDTTSPRVRIDLVSGIDIPTTTLGLADIEIPKVMEGKDLFAKDFQRRDHVIAARDRLGIAVDRIRAVVSDRYSYLRNFKTDRALYQSNYRDRYPTFVTLRTLFSQEHLSALHASYHRATERPDEELYDLHNDPHQVVNLASNPNHVAELEKHRKLLKDWIAATDDKGQYPESKESLRLVYEGAKGKCPAPEFDFLRTSPQPE